MRLTKLLHGQLAGGFLVLSTLSLVACSEGSGPASPPSSGPPAIVHTLAWTQQPGTEVVQCHTFKLPNATPVEIERIRFAFASGSHHVHIYRSNEPAPDGQTDCSAGINWPRWRLVVGAQTKPLDWELPAGLTLPMDANAQLLVQVHWLNTTSQPVDERIDISFYPARVPGDHVGVMFGIDKQVAMKPGERKRVSHFCPLPAGSQVIALMGHFHTLGREYGVWLRGAGERQEAGRQVYRGLDENTLEFQDFEPALGVSHDQGLEFQCDFTNPHDYPISWGADTKTQEHCNMAAYYHPAAADDDGFCIKEVDDVGTLAGIRATLPEISVGGTTELTIETAAPVEADTDLALGASDPTALEVPAVVRMPAHARSVKAMARGLRPSSRVNVTVRLGQQTAAVPVGVRGLLLSEVLVQPAQEGGAGPWIEIANTSARPIDLAPYTITIGGGGAAGVDQGDQGIADDGIEVPLGGTLAPHGCLVVTAAAPPSVGGDTLMMMIGLPSALPEGLTGPVLVQLRDDGTAHPGAGTAPLDTMSYGLPGATGPVPAGMAEPGTSLLRFAGNVWNAAIVPTPGICELRP